MKTKTSNLTKKLATAKKTIKFLKEGIRLRDVELVRLRMKTCVCKKCGLRK